MSRMQTAAAALGITMCEPVDFGRCSQGGYTLQTWIDGQDAEAVVPGLPPERQYALGREAGAILKKLHSIPTPPCQPVW